MAWLDCLVVASYLGGLLALGFWLKSQDSGTQYFLGNRSFGWFPLALSTAAT